MHYIRFLKPPCVTNNPQTSIHAKVTITTDLGERFLTQNIPILVELVPSRTSRNVPPREYLWRGRDGMRALDIALDVREAVRHRLSFETIVRAKDDRYHRGSFASILPELSSTEDGIGQHSKDDEGGIVAVQSLPLVNPERRSAASPASHASGAIQSISLRVFTAQDGEGKEVELRIAEDTGESIARHIWDAGLMLSSYLALLSTLSSTTASSRHQKPPYLPLLQHTLSLPSLRIIELGAGCGIVGLTLATFYANVKYLLLTDLEEAMECLGRNIEAAREDVHGTVVAKEVLDWEHGVGRREGSGVGNDGEEEIERGVGKENEKWDLILVADCTYNPDVVPDLVRTVKDLVLVRERAVAVNNESQDSLHTSTPKTSNPKNGTSNPNPNPDTLVLLAMKIRHDSELAFFDLMSDAGFVVAEKCVLPSRMVGGEKEEIEVYVFRWESSG